LYILLNFINIYKILLSILCFEVIWNL
jgi:hypothetical protein